FAARCRRSFAGFAALAPQRDRQESSLDESSWIQARRGHGGAPCHRPRTCSSVRSGLCGDIRSSPSMGEELNAAEVTERGLRGDRAYALVDRADGKVASAKNPRKWPSLFDFRATFIEPPSRGANLPPVRIVLPDGSTVSSAQRDVDQVLSTALHREVTLEAIAGGDVGVGSSSGNPRTANAEEYWPDMEGLDYRDTVTDFALPEGTF